VASLACHRIVVVQFHSGRLQARRLQLDSSSPRLLAHSHLQLRQCMRVYTLIASRTD